MRVGPLLDQCPYTKRNRPWLGRCQPPCRVLGARGEWARHPALRSFHGAAKIQPETAQGGLGLLWAGLQEPACRVLRKALDEVAARPEDGQAQPFCL